MKIWVKLNIRNLVKNYPVLHVRSWTLELDLDLDWDNFKITCLQSIKWPNQKYFQDLFSVGCMMKSNSSPEQNYFNWFIIDSVSKYNCRNYKLKMKIVVANKIINWQLKIFLKRCFLNVFFKASSNFQQLQFRKLHLLKSSSSKWKLKIKILNFLRSQVCTET